MGPQSILLAIANAVRPTGIAAVYALLSTRIPRRLLLVYIVGGFTWAFAVGILVVVVIHGVKIETGSSSVYAVISLGLGGASAGYAGGIAVGRFEAPTLKRSSGESKVSRALRTRR